MPVNGEECVGSLGWPSTVPADEVRVLKQVDEERLGREKVNPLLQHGEGRCTQ